MSNLVRPASLLAVLALFAACGGSGVSGGSSTPAGSPGVSAGSSPVVSPPASTVDLGAIEHATGTTDIVLRYDEGGGFVAPSFMVSQTPIFTLYGDGTVVFRNTTAQGPAPDGSVIRQSPLRTARLSEDQIQGLLSYALGEGRLGIARAQYDFGGVADASTATFTIDAGGIKKTVNVYALGMDTPDLPDRTVREAFARLAGRLGNLDQGGTLKTDIYRPAAYRAILMDGTGMTVPDIRPWPWKGIAPRDFAAPSDPNAFQAATKTLTPEGVAALGIKDPEGGLTNLILNGAGDGKLYSLALRPLLPDETK